MRYSIEHALRDEGGHAVDSDDIVLQDTSDREAPLLAVLGVRDHADD